MTKGVSALPDLVLYNGQLHSQDPKFPQATALALRGDRILAMGQDDEILALGDGRAPTINLAGRRVLPGLIDSHFHLYQWALLMRGVQLADAGSLDRVRERVRGAVAAARPGEWILGRGWNQTEWPHPALPGRADLDDIAPHNPVALWRSDGHLAWVNSQTLRAAGITAETPDPEAGIIDRDETGHPTGILRERAISLVRDVMPPPQDDELDQALQVAMVAAQRLGLTGVHDMRISDKEEGRASFRAYQRLRAEGKLGLRICMMLTVEHLGDAVALGLRSGFGDDQLYVGGVKIFADGSTGARTAWMLEPFEDAGSGLPLTRPDELAHLIGRAHEAGLATAVHAIGDRAIRELLNVFDQVLAKHPATLAPLVPHRIEHVQHGHPDDLGRLAALGLVASVQPLHIADDMVMIDRACGERARWAYAFRTLLSAGTVLAFGSDCPVAAPDPLWGIHAAVTRRRRDGTPPEGWHPEQRLSVAEAVWAYTLGSAHAGGQSAHLGSLTPGKLADLVVLDRDIFTIPYEEIAQARVCLTVFNGQVVYRSETFY
jgi:predicted amidohydrolase YtcJ